MQICMLSELFYPYMLGGAERRYYEIAKRLAKRHEITVYALRLRGVPDKEVIDGIEIRRLGISHPLNRRSFMPLASYFPAFLKAVKNEYDVIDVNQGMASFMGIVKPIIKKPMVATFHDIYWNKWNRHFAFPYSNIGKFMEFVWSKTKYTKIIANSPETKEKLENLKFRSTVEMIPSGVDMRLINSINGKKGGNTVVYVGRLEGYKNVETVLHAVAKVRAKIPDIKLNVVGSGPKEAELKKLASDLSIDAEFFGFVDEKKKFEIIKSSDVLINPSFVEGLGLIVLEAMACKVPVIARDLKCYFFCNGKNSVRYTNKEKLPELIVDIIQNKNRRNAMARNGYQTAKQFSWDETTKKIENLYKNCLH